MDKNRSQLSCDNHVEYTSYPLSGVVGSEITSARQTKTAIMLPRGLLMGILQVHAERGLFYNF